MPNYDLGTAHGRIKIESDNAGIRAAVANIERLKATAAALSSKLAETKDRLVAFASNLRRSSEQVDGAHRRLTSLRTVIEGVANSTETAAIRTMHFAAALGRLGRDGYEAAQRLDQLQQSVTQFASVGGILKGIVGHFSDMSERLEGLGGFQGHILKAASAVAGLGVATKGIQTLAPRLRAAIVATSAFGLLAPKISNMAGQWRAAAFAIGLAYPALGRVSDRFTRVGRSLSVFGSTASEVGSRIGRLITNMATMVVGATLVGKALEGIGKAAKIGTLALGAMGIAAAAIQIVGTFALGAWDALKQLSGALLILPGALFSLGLAGGVAMVAFKGISSAFKAMSLEGQAFTDATKNMSPGLRDAALAGQGLYKEFKGLGDVINERVWSDVGNQIRNIGQQYMPTLRNGVDTVALGLNRVKNGFVDFLQQPATIQDLNKAFSMTGNMLGNLSQAVWPFMAALRDIGMVGMDVMNDLSYGIGGAASKFGMFISEARRNGDLKRWILDGIQGFKDLASIIGSTGSIIGSFFRAFGSNGENALSRAANAMRDFAQSTKESAAGGGLKTVTDALHRMSDVTFNSLGIAVRGIIDAMQKLAPFAERASEAFGGALASALKIAATLLGAVATALGAFPAGGAIIGTILGIAAGFKIIAIVATPITRSIQLMAGSFMLLRGATGVLANLNGAMLAAGASARVAGVQLGLFGTAVSLLGTKMTVVAAMQRQFLITQRAVMAFGTGSLFMARAAGTAAAAMTGLKAAMSGLMSLLGGGIGIAIMAIVGAFMAFNAQSRDAAALQQHLADRANATTKSIQGFTRAFEEANGVMGEKITQEAVSQFEALKEEMDSVEGSGVMSDIGAFFKDTFGASNLGNAVQFWEVFQDGANGAVKSNGKVNSELDHMADNADAAKSAFEKIGWTSEDVGKAVSGTKQEFDALKTALNGVDGGDKAIEWIGPMRTGFEQTAASFDRMEEGSVSLSNALEVIGDAGSSAADKLDALKQALQALGLLEQTSEEAMFQMADTIKSVGDAAASAFDPTQKLGDAMLDANGKLSAFNADGTVNSNAAVLREKLKMLGDDLMQVAASGGDVQGAFNNMWPVFAQLGEASGFSAQKIAELGAGFGLLPRELQLMMMVNGAPEAQQEIAAVLLGIEEAQRKGQSSITIPVNAAEARAAIQGVLGDLAVIDESTGEVKINIQGDAAKNKINDLLAGVATLAQMAGVPIEIPAPQTPAPLPPPEGSVPEIAAPPVEAPQTPAPLPPPAESFVPMAGAPILPSQTPAPLPPPPAAPIPAPQVLPPVVPPMPSIPAPPPIPLTADPGPAMGAIGEVSGALAGGVGAWNDYAAGVAGAMANAVGACQSAASSAIGALNGAAGGAFGSGSSLGAGFAAGIQSQVGAVAAAAAALAAAASAPLPNSPAKVGPFSGKGWTPFRGAALAEGFAQGILGGAGTAGEASMALAMAVDDALKSISSSWAIPITSAAGKYITDATKNEAQLKAENDKKIAEEDKAEARAKLKEEQQKAKKPPEEKTESDSPKSAEQIAKDEAKTAEDLRQEKMDAALKLLERGNGTAEQVADAVNTVADNTDAKQDDVRQALNVIGSQDSSQIDVLNALDAIDRNIATQSDIETQDTLEQLKTAAMGRKGINAYDPMESASTDVPKDVMEVIGQVFGLVESIESTAKGAGELVELLTRGISDTDGITKAIDGVQGLASGLGGIADTVGGVIGTVANIAAAAGSIIPGVGAITAGISAVTGGIGQVNAIVDLVQQGFQIAGRVAGGLLSRLAGGRDGALYGNVRTLIDTNDKTIKRWSDANAMDKRSNSYDLFNRGNQGNNESNAIKNLNIYQGPGTDPYKMTEEMMFAVRAAGNGAWSD